MNPTNGKGSAQRPTNTQAYESSYDRIFSTKRPDTGAKQEPGPSSPESCSLATNPVSSPKRGDP